MSDPLTPDGLMTKALRACESAHALLNLDDSDGACNRAYYAMFDAARAALMISGVSPDVAKTHSGLIAAFGLHLVKTGRVPVELGKAFNRAEEIRLEADYKGNSIPTDKAREIVEQSQTFVAAMSELLSRMKNLAASREVSTSKTTASVSAPTCGELNPDGLKHPGSDDSDSTPKPP